MTFDGFISYSHAADGRLAPAVQHGLHRLAKPWHRRRALWIFRDQTGLSVTPALWPSIQQALDGSQWFVLLASPEAARSPWVNREIEHWIATKPADRILPVVTDGTWRWDAGRGDLAADSTAVPAALRGVFAEEPLFLDLRWARDDAQLSLQHSRFRDAVAQLAAPMHGVSKDELEGEDVRQHRRIRRLRRVAVAALAGLTLVASLAGGLAQHNAERATASAVEARRQEQVASQQRGNAERSTERAQRLEENVRTQEARARAAGLETERQGRLAQRQQGAAERAAREAARQLSNARRQQQLAAQATKLAEQQRSLAREQRELAQRSARETSRQKIIAEWQQRLAAEATAEADRQKRIAKQQQRIAAEATAEARRQEDRARANEQKAEDAAAEADRQKREAAEQKQIALGRRLLNQARAMIGNDPATALKLGIAAHRIQPGTEASGELTGLVTSTRRIGTIADSLQVAYGPGDVLAVIDYEFGAALWSVADLAVPVRLAALDGQSFVGQPVFSPDGRTLAMVGGSPFQPVLFDVSDPARPKRIGEVPAPEAGWLTFSPDGQMLSTVDLDGQWVLWDVTDRAAPDRLTTQTKGYGGPLAFSPDGRAVVTAGSPGTVWDITDRRKPRQVAILDGKWRRVAFHPVRPLLATNDNDGNLALWHIDNRAKPQKYFTQAGRITSVAFGSTGLTMVTGDARGTDGAARLWDMTANTPVPVADLADNSGSGYSQVFSPDGRTLATTGSAGTLSLWTVTAHSAPAIIGRATGDDYQYGQAAALTADGRRMTTTASYGAATVWDMSTPTDPVPRGTAQVRFGSHLDTAAVSPDGTIVAALAGLSDSVTLTDLTDPAKPAPLDVLPGGHYSGALTFAPDGHTLAARRDDSSTVALWDLTDRRHPLLIADLTADTVVSALSFSPDGRTLAVATDRKVTLWNLTDPARPTEIGTPLKGHTDRITAMAFSPDGRSLATGSEDKTAALWNVADRTRPRRQAILTGNTGPVRSVAFAPDGRTLATGTSTGIDGDDTATLWDVAELSGPVRIATLRGTELRSTSMLFHPDGHTLITSGSGFSRTRAVVWDHSDLNTLRADPAGRACAITGGGFTEEEWAAFVPEVPYQPTCGRVPTR